MTGFEFIDRIKIDGERLAEEYESDPALEIKQNKGYISLLFFNQVFLRVRETKQGAQIELKRAFLSELPFPSDLFSFSKSSPDWGRTLLTDEVAELILNNLPHIFFKCYAMISDNTFGCCNSFLRCSDIKRCIHPNKLFASGCLYRKNLESGRIFYGDNRNIN